MLSHLPVEALRRLLKLRQVATDPIADFRPGICQSVGILPNGKGDNIALLAGKGRVSMEALLAFQHRDEALLDLWRRLADLPGHTRVATHVDVHVASPCPGEWARDAAPRESRGSTMMGLRRSAGQLRARNSVMNRTAKRGLPLPGRDNKAKLGGSHASL